MFPHEASKALLVVLAFILAEGSALSRGDGKETTGGSFVCGTNPERQAQARAKGRYIESMNRRRQPALAAAGAREAAAPADVGNVAVIQDDGTILTDINSFDLAGAAVRFEPGLANSFRVVASAAVYDGSGGTPVSLADDDTKEIQLGFTFSFFGRFWDRVQLNSDGNLTFGAGDTATSARDLGRFVSGPPRIGPFFSDLNPPRGIVSYRREPDGIVFLWDRVPDYDFAGNVNSFSVKLYRDGRIEFVYGSTLRTPTAIVGVSPGGGDGEIHAIDYKVDLPTGELRGSVVEVFSDAAELSEAALARKFFKTHPDEFDQLVVFLGFYFKIPGAFAYEINTKNEIRGIGHAIVDESADYGSNGRLRSFVLMGSLDGDGRFPDDPTAPNFFRTYSTLQVLAHEVAHRWLAFSRLQFGNFSPNVLLKSDRSHWSFFFNANGSVMEGNDIEDRGPGSGTDRFRTVGQTNKYSDLDRYLMGYASKEEVPPMFFVSGPVGTFQTADSLPSVASTVFGGTRQDFTIDNIIGANDSRVPSVLQSPKILRQAFILLTKKDQDATAAQIAKLQRIHDAWLPYFNQQTAGRGFAVTSLQSTPGTTSLRLNFPHFQGDLSRFTGVAVANWGDTPADVLFRAYDNSGNPMASPSAIINPRLVTVPAGAQMALLAEQIHGLSLSDTRNGWIQAESSSSQVSGFFLDGDVDLTLLDGATVGSAPATVLFFTRARLGTGVFGAAQYRHVINVVNPGDSPAAITLTLVDEFGTPVTATTRTLPAKGRLSEELPALFPGIATTPLTGYVKLVADAGVVGYQSIDGGNAVFALPAQPASESTRLYSAQFASGKAGTVRYFTDLNLINTSAQTRIVRLSLTGNDGLQVDGILNPTTVTLEPGSQIRTKAETLFRMPDPAFATRLVEGSLLITADGPGILGDVTFGDPVEEKFLASLPLDSKPTSRLVLSQVAQGSTGPGGKPYFTGLAVLNPNSTDVTVTVEVYSERGERTGSSSLVLVPGGRVSRTLPELVPGFTAQVRGYIRVSSFGGPVIAFELFGDQALDFLAAVPSQAIGP